MTVAWAPSDGHPRRATAARTPAVPEEHGTPLRHEGRGGKGGRRGREAGSSEQQYGASDQPASWSGK